jgi:hypothetical protein
MEKVHEACENVKRAGTHPVSLVLSEGDPGLREAFAVPRVVDELSGKMVLTTELMHGRPLNGSRRQSRDEKAAWRKSTRLVKT